MSTPGNSKRNESVSQPLPEPPADGGRMIVLTAPLTEAIDHAGYFIHMAMASLSIWMEGIINRKYPKWREVDLALPQLGRGWAYYAPVEKELRSCVAERPARARSARTCTLQERILGLCE